MRERNVGFRFLMIIGALFLVMLLIGQMMSFINYEFTVSLGLQESVDVVGETGVAVNKGFGVGDTMIYIPLLVSGLLGLWRKKRWGVYTMVGAMAITAYWPIVCLFFLLFSKNVPGINITNYLPYVILLTSFTIYGLWGLWYLYSRRNELVT